MKKHQPLISILIPTYNCEQYLTEAIQSVLAQTYQNIEIIVIDDGSTDGSAEIAQSYTTVRYELQTHQGAGAARNRGAELAQGQFLAFLDADDLWVTDKLSHQMTAFENNPQLDMVFGHVKQFHSPDLDDNLKQQIHCPSEPIAGYHPGTMLIKRDTFFQIGTFDTHWKLGEFVDWYLKAVEKGMKSMMLSTVLMHRRLHSTNLGRRERQFQTDYVRILKASLDRRRKMGQ